MGRSCCSIHLAKANGSQRSRFVGRPGAFPSEQGALVYGSELQDHFQASLPFAALRNTQHLLLAAPPAIVSCSSTILPRFVFVVLGGFSYQNYY